MNEPYKKEGSCSFCGNAPINHTVSFLENLVSITLDNHAKFFLKFVPRFINDFVDLIPEFLFRTLVFSELAKFSGDINKARSFRSRIVWEEAKKRGIIMEQVIFLGNPLDYYRALLKNKNRLCIYFISN